MGILHGIEVKALAGKRINQEGDLLIAAHRFRTQERNRQDAIERLVALIQKAATPPKPRIKTKPSRAAKQRRLEEKWRNRREETGPPFRRIAGGERMNAATACPCGSGKSYPVCCGPYLDHGQPPATAEALMRSRYSGYVLVREEYLLRTWHESTRPGTLDLSGDAGTVNWLGLEIVRAEAGNPGDTRGVVEFVARYKVGGKAHRLHETSRFVREGGQWFYLDGTLHAATKSGRK